MKDHLEEEQELLQRLLEKDGVASATAVMADPEVTALQPGMEAEPYAAPRTALEQHLATIWADVLGVPRVGIHDDFFALGGGSLCGAVMTARVEDTLAIDLPVRELFESSTIAELAAVIQTNLGGKELRIKLPEEAATAVSTREADSRTSPSLFPAPRNNCGFWTVSSLAATSTTWLWPGGSRVTFMFLCWNAVSRKSCGATKRCEHASSWPGMECPGRKLFPMQ